VRLTIEEDVRSRSRGGLEEYRGGGSVVCVDMNRCGDEEVVEDVENRREKTRIDNISILRMHVRCLVEENKNKLYKEMITWL
jgi:hypothetical protein